jgi:hypothetical protein
VFVADGQSDSFNPALTMSSITNLTSKTYCVSASASFALRSGESLTATESVFNVEPGGPMCPL